MKVEQLYTKCIAEAAYFIASNGEAAIIDPLRETQPYLDLIKKGSKDITDFVKKVLSTKDLIKNVKVSKSNYSYILDWDDYNSVATLNYLQKNNVNCNEGPCPEIYKEKLFKRLKIYPSVKLTNASQLGKKSIAYHINPFITSNKLDRDIKLLRQNLFKCIKIF